ncbi:uncharacterized protein MYCFIDRAFT_175504 [Pseudocercospora fijiensis CIRAD86]|uniref:Uncharacterized protein n=1 Tax=Pseudocercospora fijiensis (strain CIRAD86) TaxID=383855 RepID=M3ABG5_PSEFD|nr:uncharacterized protein MYCFIDRAFT_175504 [Pseudocercospora fijiensis CIRAD86]EME81926.1 hypothetical protein MYCFIDRAFT_175504 [Pseudocercospora fijiensis CIRAD86]
MHFAPHRHELSPRFRARWEWLESIYRLRSRSPSLRMSVAKRSAATDVHFSSMIYTLWKSLRALRLLSYPMGAADYACIEILPACCPSANVGKWCVVGLVEVNTTELSGPRATDVRYYCERDRFSLPLLTFWNGNGSNISGMDTISADGKEKTLRAHTVELILRPALHQKWTRTPQSLSVVAIHSLVYTLTNRELIWTENINILLRSLLRHRAASEM